jgi:hypothetical protein
MDMMALLKAQVEADSDALATSKVTIGGSEVTLMASGLTGQDMAFARKKQADFMSNPSLEAMVDLIIRKAKTPDGNAAFTLEHKPVLVRQKVALISTIFSDLFGDALSVEQTEDEAEARKGKS